MSHLPGEPRRKLAGAREHLEATDHSIGAGLIQEMSHALDRTTVILGAQSFTVAEGIEPPPEVRTALVAGGSPPYTMTMFLSLAALRSVGGFDESFAVGEDLELLMRLQRSGVPVVQHDEVWTIRRVFGDNLVYDVDGLSRARLRAVRNNRPAKASAT